MKLEVVAVDEGQGGHRGAREDEKTGKAVVAVEEKERTEEEEAEAAEDREEMVRIEGESRKIRGRLRRDFAKLEQLCMDLKERFAIYAAVDAFGDKLNAHLPDLESEQLGGGDGGAPPRTVAKLRERNARHFGAVLEGIVTMVDPEYNEEDGTLEELVDELNETKDEIMDNMNYLYEMETGLVSTAFRISPTSDGTLKLIAGRDYKELRNYKKKAIRLLRMCDELASAFPQYLFTTSVYFNIFPSRPLEEQSDPPTCGLCRGEIPKDSSVPDLQCTHTFHFSCLQPHVFKKNGTRTCPTCAKPVRVTKPFMEWMLELDAFNVIFTEPEPSVLKKVNKRALLEEPVTASSGGVAQKTGKRRKTADASFSSPPSVTG